MTPRLLSGNRWPNPSSAPWNIDYLDAYLLHGPYTRFGLVQEDWHVWRGLEALHRRGLARMIGISNVSTQQLQLLLQDAEIKPMIVQNRCFANQGWDRAVRQLCRKHDILYQGFSLLTANPQILAHPVVRRLSAELKATPAQVIFRFSVQVGMVALTGTTDGAHMRQDLAAMSLELTSEQVEAIESLAG
jgi:diketogulonate reductase-like aldo/keto reductase